MTSEPQRDPITDPLLTPQNSALIIIDYQPNQVRATRDNFRTYLKAALNGPHAPQNDRPSTGGVMGRQPAGPRGHEPAA